MSKVATVTMDFDIPDGVSESEIEAYLMNQLSGTEVDGVRKDNFRAIEDMLWDSDKAGLWVHNISIEDE